MKNHVELAKQELEAATQDVSYAQEDIKSKEEFMRAYLRSEAQKTGIAPEELDKVGERIVALNQPQIDIDLTAEQNKELQKQFKKLTKQETQLTNGDLLESLRTAHEQKMEQLLPTAPKHQLRGIATAQMVTDSKLREELFPELDSLGKDSNFDVVNKAKSAVSILKTGQDQKEVRDNFLKSFQAEVRLDERSQEHVVSGAMTDSLASHAGKIEEHEQAVYAEHQAKKDLADSMERQKMRDDIAPDIEQHMEQQPEITRDRDDDLTRA